MKAVRLILHSIVLIFLTTKVVYLDVYYGDYVRSMSRSWQYFFYPQSIDFNEVYSVVYTVDDTIESIYKVFNTFVNLNSISTAELSYGGSDGIECNSTFSGLEARTSFWESPHSVATYSVHINNISDFSFITDDSREYFSSLDTLTLKMNICNVVRKSLHDDDCFYWKVNVVYSFVSQLYLSVSIDDSLYGKCDHSHEGMSQAGDLLLWIEAIVLVSAVVYAILCIKVKHQVPFLMQPLIGSVFLNLIIDIILIFVVSKYFTFHSCEKQSNAPTLKLDSRT
jgi:hypothetical protein